MVRVLAKSTTCCRTTSIPRSSEAFSSSVMLLSELPYICRATARMVDVLPVPGGPYSSRCGSLFSFTSLRTAMQHGRMPASDRATLRLCCGCKSAGTASFSDNRPPIGREGAQASIAIRKASASAGLSRAVTATGAGAASISVFLDQAAATGGAS